jgi:hypothetical protein
MPTVRQAAWRDALCGRFGQVLLAQADALGRDFDSSSSSMNSSACSATSGSAVSWTLSSCRRRGCSSALGAQRVDDQVVVLAWMPTSWPS